MSERNGDRARFQKNRKRKLRHRARMNKLAAAQAAGPTAETPRDKAARR